MSRGGLSANEKKENAWNDKYFILYEEGGLRRWVRIFGSSNKQTFKFKNKADISCRVGHIGLFKFKPDY